MSGGPPKWKLTQTHSYQTRNALKSPKAFKTPSNLNHWPAIRSSCGPKRAHTHWKGFGIGNYKNFESLSHTFLQVETFAHRCPILILIYSSLKAGCNSSSDLTIAMVRWVSFCIGARWISNYYFIVVSTIVCSFCLVLIAWNLLSRLSILWRHGL